MIREVLGLGPNHYSIIKLAVPKFSRKVLLLMRYLAHEKNVYLLSGL